ncbi:erythromycin esterase family protein [Tsukamurella sp. 8F]|uniref:erythromycin esterase family protein n=1 Tax=unclassified Tsukamurella TaxID=2633480 RepID=UPI0023B968DA|nr:MULTISPECIES: erythromycin esterase family protein [unclassified Tsukamurella]MDF0532053.1 erythromycin esterase family protein [Tsukamurella sp. 8J]MDF0587516.1 erythromycin esterase family protein [Tsukamurella sp. 8F]
MGGPGGDLRGDLPGAAAGLVDRLASSARILGWAEGIHVRAEYLAARDAVVRHLADRLVAVAAETRAERAVAADRYIRGEGTDRLDADAVGSVWTWSPTPLLQNATLLRTLRAHNASRAGAPVRFYGLETHVGDHRDLAARDAAQYESLRRVAERHPDGLILLFEQTGHVDPGIPGSLGSHVAQGELGVYRTVGALWRAGDPTVHFPLGDYEQLSARLDGARSRLLPMPGGTLLAGPEQVPDIAGSPFDAALYAPALSPAAHFVGDAAT